MHRDEERGAEPLATKGDHHSAYPAHDHAVKSRGTSKVARAFDSFLRILALLATVAAIIVLLKSNQQKRVQVARGVFVPAWAKWQYADPFKYFLAANAAIAGYSLSMTILTCCNKHGSTILVFFDFIAASILISAASSATTLAYLGYRGDDHLQWQPICGSSKFRHFCYKIAGALLCSYIGWIALAISTILAAHRLRRKY